MLLLCCTKKLRDSWRLTPDTEELQSTTVLGTWYANIIHTHKGAMILCVNEYSRMAIVCEFSGNPATFQQEFLARTAVLLESMEIPDKSITEELALMEEIAFVKTRSRSVLGTINDFAHLMEGYIHDEYVYAPLSLEQLSGLLTYTPIGPKRYFFPTERVYERFGCKAKRWEPTRTKLFGK